jgi:type II secretory ATPase GspE/PulE/Tfp pilus assembly ATPase PilB-like protein
MAASVSKGIGMMAPNPTLKPAAPADLETQLAYRQALLDITNEIHAAQNLNEILIDLKDRILSLFQADRITIYVVDGVTKEIYSRFKVGEEVSEFRVPISATSIAGYVALSGRTINISNCYDDKEIAAIHPNLRFDKSWDGKTGYRTTQMLAVTIKFDRYTLGVLQCINRTDGSRFTLEDEGSAQEIAKILGIAFYNQHKMSRRRPTKFDHLVKQHLIMESELEKATIEARDQHLDIEYVLMKNYNISKQDLGTALSHFYKCPFVTFDDRLPIPGDLLRNLKVSYLRSNLWVPLEVREGRVMVLMDDPSHLTKRDSVQSLLSPHRIDYCVGLKEDILKFIGYFFGAPGQEGSINEILGKLEVEDATEQEEQGVDDSDSAIVQLVNKVITDAYTKRASDIHIEPYPGKHPLEIRLRIDGACMPYQTVPYQFKRAVVSRIKIMSELDITERRLPQDGKIQFRKFGGKDIELRVATLPTQGGLEDVVMRILSSGEPMSLDKMGFSERNLALFKRLIEMPYGIILVVGPTGSGKTTTLHSALACINRPDRKIWTAEDPVEITQGGLRQVQVNPKIGFTFANAMRAFLRADPDVIMVGEMRDEETCATGIEASLTGHLVFSTLHTNSAPETITRLLDMGMDPFNFADALLGILAQRLARTLCKECKEAYYPDETEVRDLALDYGEEAFARLGITYSKDLTLYRAKGCPSCNGTGYRGRMAIHELLEGTDEIKRLIQLRQPTEEIRLQARRDSMTTLKQDGIVKVFKGLTDIRQVRSVCIK